MRLSLVVGLLVSAVASAEAQRLSLSPQIGLYIPTENLYQLAAGGGEDFQLEAGPSFGARLGLWFGQRFGIGVTGSYVPTTFKLSTSGGGTPVKQDAKLFVGTGQAILFLIPRSSPLSLFLSGGVGVVSRGGVAFTNEAETSNLGAVIGGGAEIRLGGIMLTAGADLVTYDAAYKGSQVSTQELKQKDISLKLGLGIPFGGGGASRP